MFSPTSLCRRLIPPVLFMLAGVLPVSADSPNRNLLLVIDGLHPGYVTPAWMPNLHALGERGVFGERHTAVYPTYTRPNASSISTGSFPQRHGIVHNTMWVPEAGDGNINVGSAVQLRRLEAALSGPLFTAPTVGELLEEAGLLYLVCGSSGTGTALLQNHKGKGLGVWNARGYFHPPEMEEKAVQALGELPGNDRAEQTPWAFDAYLHHALGDIPPAFTLMWINEPDSAGHAHGVGSPEALEAVGNVDRHIGRILAAHEEHGLTDKINIFVTSDHGFTTNLGGFSVARVLGDAGLDGDGVRVVNNMIFLDDARREDKPAMVEALQRSGVIGAVYPRPSEPGSSIGAIPGTISTELIRWNHERSADILVSPAWTFDVNEFGFAGGTTRGGSSAATHGSDSPYDLHIRLVAAGPDIKRGVRSQVPTGNVDFIPTVLHLLGVERPETMDGRVMRELLAGGPDPEEVPVREFDHRAGVTFADGFRYETEIETLQVGRTHYHRGAWTARQPPANNRE